MRTVFFGWWVVLASLILGAFSIGVGYFTVPVFYGTLMSEFDWSRTQVVAGGSIALTVYGLLSPAAGIATDLYGAKRTKVIGIVVLGVGLLLFPLISNLFIYFSICILLGVGMSGIDGAPTQVLISKWFKRYEGLAMGIVVGGVGLGGFLGPIAASYLIENYDWQTAFLVLAGVLWFAVLPLFALLVREAPSELGLSRDGETQKGPLEPTPTDETLAGATFREALKTSAFWTLNAGTFFLLFAIFALTQNWVLYFEQDRGLSLQKASALLGFLFMMSIPGKILMGWLADRISRKWIMVFCCACVTVSLVILTTGPLSDPVLYLCSGLLGLSYGCVFVILPLIAREYFGLHSLGKILGLLYFTLSLGGALGPLMVGRIRDITGGYEAGLILLLGMSIAAIPIFGFMKRPLGLAGMKLTGEGRESEVESGL